ncbi:DedA family protein [Herbiconiux sp. UC225_62]|uniref:DedA family protein n=1 Tax=Herbiconiux sp. UC225_62 TaxID=3350168 RepID=UPI0036D3A370
MNEVLSWLLDTVQSVDPLVRTLLAGVAILLETSILIGLVVPGDTVVLVASTAVDGPLEYISLVAVVIVGALCGESIGFAIGRWFGPKLRASRLGRRIGEKNWVRAETYLAKRGGIAVFLSRFIPVLHSLIPLTVGMSPMRYRRFMTWTVPACVIWAFAYVSVGAFAAGSYRELSRDLHWAGYLFVGVIALFVVAVFVAKKLINRSESRHMQEAPPSPDESGDDGAS